jgi:hypothetical protein
MLYVRNIGLLPDDDKYRPMLHWPPQASKLGFLSSFNINKKFLIDRVPSCPTFEIWDFGQIGEQAKGAADLGIITPYFSHAKTFQMSPHHFNSIQKNSSYT